MGNKLFVSCPMKGRNKDDIEISIKTLHKVAEIMFDKKLDVIQTYIQDDAPDGINSGLWYLGKSIEKLAGADYFIGCSNLDFASGEGRFSACEIERHAAASYGIPNTFINCRDFKCFDDVMKNENRA